MILISGCSAHKIVTFILVKKKKKDCDIHAAVERLISVRLFQEKGKQTILQPAWTGCEIEVCDGLQVSIAMYQF